MKETLNITELPNEVIDLLRHGTFDYNLCSVTNYTGINLRESSDFLNKTRSSWACTNEKDFFMSVKLWLSKLLSNIDNYLTIPEVMKLCANVLQQHENKGNIPSETSRLESLRLIFLKSNTEFQKCSINCTGVDKCCCILEEFRDFYSHFISKFKPSTSYHLKYASTEEGISDNISYVQAFSQYLKYDGYHADLKCVNIMRILELTSIMKPSQSATERTMSHVANTVQNRFESKTQNATDFDAVNVEVFLQCNINMATLNNTQARQFFLNKHQEMLIKSKPITHRSKTVKNLLATLKGKKAITKDRKKKIFTDKRFRSNVKKFISIKSESDSALPVSSSQINLASSPVSTSSQSIVTQLSTPNTVLTTPQTNSSSKRYLFYLHQVAQKQQLLLSFFSKQRKKLII